MTRSVEELRRESERNREQLTRTVDQLRLQITDTAADIRNKVSPQHIKSEVSDFISSKTLGWIDSLKQHAKENPMQAIAAGTAIAVPVLRLARGFPLPLLMIGAGLALSSKNVRERATDAAAPAVDRVAGDAMERVQSLQGDMRQAVDSARSKVAGMANEAYAAAAGVADDIENRAEQAADSANDKLETGMYAARDSMERARAAVNDAVTGAPEKAGRAIGDNALLIGSLGIAIGAIIAASLPATRVEASARGEASDDVRRAAGNAAKSGFEAAKDAAVSMVDAAAKSVAEADLGGHASRITENMTGTLTEIADDVVKTALNPSRNPNP
jgi:hypothetical protein